MPVFVRLSRRRSSIRNTCPRRGTTSARRPPRGTRSRSSEGSRSSRRCLGPDLSRRERARPRGRSQPEHRAPLCRDADQARIPRPGSGDEEVPPRATRARPGLLRHQLDGAPRDRGAASPAAQRRDRSHGEHGDPRRRRDRLHRALPRLAAGPARDRPQPARRLAASRLLHLSREGAPRVPRRAAQERDARSDRVRPAGAEHDHEQDRALLGARADPLARDRRLERGARLGSALDGDADSRSQSEEAVAAVNLAVHRSLGSMEELVARLSPALERTVTEISRRLGHRPLAGIAGVEP